MDIAKIRKKAKEKEEADRASQDRPPRGEAPADANVPSPAREKAEKEEGPEEQAVSAGGEEPYEGEKEGTPGGGEAPPPPPAVDKQGERGFSGETETDEDGAVLELLTFSIANEEFAFRVPEVEEIIRHQRITKVPTMPDYMMGITSLRGKIIPVLDLRKRLGLKDAGPEAQTKEADGKILIMAGPKGMIGATIHRVLGVVRFEEGMVLDPPGHLSEDALRFIEGVVIREKRFISIIRSYDALDVELT